MKASAKLNVLPSMTVSLNITMTVEEMDAILKVLHAENAWPVWQLKNVLSDTLRAARDSFHAEHESKVV